MKYTLQSLFTASQREVFAVLFFLIQNFIQRNSYVHKCEKKIFGRII